MNTQEETADRLMQRDLLEDARRHAAAYNVTLGEFLSGSRRKGIVAARHAFWAELYSRGHWSYPRIAELFGVDHTSVMYGVWKHGERRASAAISSKIEIAAMAAEIHEAQR